MSDIPIATVNPDDPIVSNDYQAYATRTTLLANDVLYNQFALTMQNNPLAKLNDWVTDLRLNGTGAKITAEEANSKYGVPGFLQFDGDIDEQVAIARNQRAQVREIRSRIASMDDDSLITEVGKIGVGFGSSILDPITLGASVIPFGRYFSAGAKAEAIIGTRSAYVAGETALQISFKEAMLNRLGLGAFEGVVGNIPVEAMQYALAKEEGTPYGLDDALGGLTAGLVFGSLFKGMGGIWETGFNKLKGTPRAQFIKSAMDDISIGVEPNPMARFRVSDDVLDASANAGKRLTDDQVIDVLSGQGHTIPNIYDSIVGGETLPSIKEISGRIDKNDPSVSGLGSEARDAISVLDIANEQKVMPDGTTVSASRLPEFAQIANETFAINKITKAIQDVQALIKKSVDNGDEAMTKTLRAVLTQLENVKALKQESGALKANLKASEAQALRTHLTNEGKQQPPKTESPKPISSEFTVSKTDGVEGKAGQEQPSKYVPQEQLSGKQVEVEYTNAATGEKVKRLEDAWEAQNSIRRTEAFMLKLKNCLGAK